MPVSSNSVLCSPFQGPPPLVVEGSGPQREQLVDALKRAGFSARQASGSREALREANSAPVAVVLIDNILHDQLDGIGLALEIQRLHPYSSVIFVIERDLSRIDWSRIRAHHVHVEGAVEKPVAFRVQELARLVEKAQIKVQVRALLGRIEERHLDPVTYLHALADMEPSFPPQAFLELLEELRSREARIPEPATEQDPNGALAQEIDCVYDEIRDLVERQADDPDFPQLLQVLQGRLEALEEREADAMELRYRAQFELDSAAGERLLERAAHLLGEK